MGATDLKRRDRTNHRSTTGTCTATSNTKERQIMSTCMTSCHTAANPGSRYAYLAAAHAFHTESSQHVYAANMHALLLHKINPVTNTKSMYMQGHQALDSLPQSIRLSEHPLHATQAQILQQPRPHYVQGVCGKPRPHHASKATCTRTRKLPADNPTWL